MLDEIRWLWLASSNAELANLLLSPDDRRTAQRQDLTDVEIIHRVLSFGRYFEVDEATTVFAAIREVTIPDFVESPFSSGEAQPNTARVAVRVELGDGRPYVVDATVQPMANPFGSRSHSFLLGP